MNGNIDIAETIKQIEFAAKKDISRFVYEVTKDGGNIAIEFYEP